MRAMERRPAVYGYLRRAALAALLVVAAQAGFADSAQLQVLREQIRQAEQLGMTEMVNSLRDLVAMLEEEEAEASAAGEPDTEVVVRSSYFSEVGRHELESCKYARDIQFDTICTAAMLRYQDYLSAMVGGAPQATQEELWSRHEQTAKVYLHSISQAGHGVDPEAPRLAGSQPSAAEAREQMESQQREARARAGQSSPPVDSTRNRPTPRAQKGCATPQ